MSAKNGKEINNNNCKTLQKETKWTGDTAQWHSAGLASVRS